MQYLSDKIDSLKLLKIDPKLGRETISGICTKCMKKNVWKNIKLFAIDYIYCDQCGKKYAIPYPKELRDNLDTNISIILKKYGKVAIWGMTLPVMDLFARSEVLKDPNIYAIDISESKRKRDDQAKRINPPQVLDENDIPAVIIAVPSHAGQIESQIRENHHTVKHILDISQLADFEHVSLD